MRKIFLLIVTLAIFFIPTCFADPQEIITEGTYTATESDSPAQAEEAALNIAKRTALEQSGTLVQAQTTVENFQLRTDQIKTISSAVMETTILDKKRWYDGNSLVFWVKIKSIVYPDKFIQAIKNGDFDGKKVFGAIVLYDPTHPVKSPMPKEYPYEQHLPPVDKILEPVKVALAEKFSTRNSSYEQGYPVKEKLIPFMKELNKNSELLLTLDDFINFASNNNYDYFIVVTEKMSNFDHAAEFMLTGGTFFMEMETHIGIIDVKNKKVILDKYFIGKDKENYTSAMGFSYDATAYDRGFATAIEKAQKNALEELNKTVPSVSNIIKNQQ